MSSAASIHAKRAKRLSGSVYVYENGTDLLTPGKCIRMFPETSNYSIKCDSFITALCSVNDTPFLKKQAPDYEKPKN